MGKIANEITGAVSEFVNTIFSLKKEYAKKFVIENLSMLGEEGETEILKLVEKELEYQEANYLIGKGGTKIIMSNLIKGENNK